MVVRVRSLAALSVALTAVPALSHADVTNTPTFNCPAGGTLQSVNWGDGTAFNAVNLQATSTDGGFQTGIEFGCSDSGGPYYYFNHGDGSHTIDEFGVNFGTIAEEKSFVFNFDTVNQKMDVYDPASGKVTPEYFTNFNLYLTETDPFGAKFRDFIGVKIESLYGFSTAKWFGLDANSQLIFDPTIPGDVEATVSLTDTPVPEPSALVLMASGLAAAVEVLRRKRRK